MARLAAFAIVVSALLVGASVSVAGADVSQFALAAPSALPTSVVGGPDGALLFTESAGNKIGRISVGGAITEFPVPTAGAVPVAITAGPGGALWFTEVAGSNIGRMTTTGAATEYPIADAAGRRPRRDRVRV